MCTGVSHPFGRRSGQLMGASGVSKSQVSRLVAEIDELVNAVDGRSRVSGLTCGSTPPTSSPPRADGSSRRRP